MNIVKIVNEFIFTYNVFILKPLFFLFKAIIISLIFIIFEEFYKLNKIKEIIKETY